MDNIDIDIIKILQKDARASLSEIGQKINLSVSAVGERVKKLENAGVISEYVAIVDGKHFNKELTAFIFVSLENPRFTEDFQKFIKQEHDILECHYIAGNFDYILKVVTNNPAYLEKLLNKIKSAPGIVKTFTNVVLATEKNNYSIYPQK